MSLKFEGTRESLITASKFGYYPNSTVISVTSGGVPFPEYEANFTLVKKDTTAPRTNVTEPPAKPDEETIEPGTPLPWTNKPVTLWFFRTDNSGSGVNYTNLSLAAGSETTSLNVVISNESAGLSEAVELNKTAEYMVNETFGEYFNVTISDECNATIEYYSVDKAGNPEEKKNLTVRIKFATTGNIIINEIMYDPEGTDSLYEWIELYNNDTMKINISGWSLNDETIETDKIMDPDSYVVLARNKTAFEGRYGTLPCSVIEVEWWPTLSNDGGTITLKNATGTEIDVPTYPDVARVNYTAELNATGGWEESSVEGGTPCKPNSVLADTEPPASITNLEYTNGTTWINWTWTNPPDVDFNYTMVYLNGEWQTNTSDPFYNATGLNPDTEYEIGTRTVDKAGNVNATWVNGTARTLPLPDTEPPASITNLQYTNGTTWINWTWTNPPDVDFNYTMVYLNGEWQTNTSDPFYNATGLNPDTEYEIGTRTVDKAGNVNATWVNGTARTLPAVAPPAIISFAPPSPVYDNENATRIFNITIDQVANVTWLMNGTQVDFDENVTEANYTNTSAVVGTWNVSAVVENANGTTMQTWIWHVLPAGTSWFTVHLKPEYNLISVPVNDTSITDAQSLIEKINAQGGNCTEVISWNGTAWLSYAPPNPLNNVAIEGGKGYFVHVTVESNVIFTGTAWKN